MTFRSTHNPSTHPPSSGSSASRRAPHVCAPASAPWTGRPRLVPVTPRKREHDECQGSSEPRQTPIGAVSRACSAASSPIKWWRKVATGRRRPPTNSAQTPIARASRQLGLCRPCNAAGQHENVVIFQQHCMTSCLLCSLRHPRRRLLQNRLEHTGRSRETPRGTSVGGQIFGLEKVASFAAE